MNFLNRFPRKGCIHYSQPRRRIARRICTDGKLASRRSEPEGEEPQTDFLCQTGQRTKLHPGSSARWKVLITSHLSEILRAPVVAYVCVYGSVIARPEMCLHLRDQSHSCQLLPGLSQLASPCTWEPLHPGDC